MLYHGDAIVSLYFRYHAWTSDQGSSKRASREAEGTRLRQPAESEQRGDYDSRTRASRPAAATHARGNRPLTRSSAPSSDASDHRRGPTEEEMIVADTNLVASLLIEREQSDVARAVWSKDSDWMLPPLWRSEFLNVLTISVRAGVLTLADAHETWKLALALFDDS